MERYELCGNPKCIYCHPEPGEPLDQIQINAMELYNKIVELAKTDPVVNNWLKQMAMSKELHQDLVTEMFSLMIHQIVVDKEAVKREFYTHLSLCSVHQNLLKDISK